jgi:hypothetical protein
MPLPAKLNHYVNLGLKFMVNEPPLPGRFARFRRDLGRKSAPSPG